MAHDVPSGGFGGGGVAEATQRTYSNPQYTTPNINVTYWIFFTLFHWLQSNLF